jgi:DNA mismatch repair protein MutS
MMRQYQEAKQLAGDALLLFRMGDFYELFFEDARVASELLGLTLTSRDKDSPNPTAMAGFPYHQLDTYLGRIIQAGYRAAVCEQVEDPQQAKGLVRREVTRVISAGTLTDDALLNPHEANWLAAIAEQSGSSVVGMAWADLSSGQFEASLLPESAVEDEIARLNVVELLVRDEGGPANPRRHPGEPRTVTRRPAWSFSIDHAERSLKQQFGVQTLEGLGFEANDRLAIQAAGALLGYLTESQRGSLAHLKPLVRYQRSSVLELDQATRRSLELTRTIRADSRDGTLLAVIDQTTTAMGARLLAQWLNAPLRDQAAIEQRLDAVDCLRQDHRRRDALRQALRSVHDLQRLVSRVATGRTNPRDLYRMGCSLARLPELVELLSDCPAQRLGELRATLLATPDLAGLLTEALQEDCPLQTNEGGYIRSGWDAELDGLRELAAGGKQWMAAYQAQQVQETGISSLKVGFNKVFGYYLEVTNAHQTKIPANYVRKQTLKNAERYVTAELKEYEDKVLSADQRAVAREWDLFCELRSRVSEVVHQLQQTADALAQLDVLAGWAQLAAQRHYVRPKLETEPILDIEDGRHPVLDALLPSGTFVPNDCQVTPSDGHVLVITGPNMAGKSTYIRQIALLTLMAHIGCFLPAKRARVGLTDRIFARVGASDELSRGQSTFMVEMVEAARILNTATRQSLVVLDEVGRGTSTFDGLSLAWAITEYLHDRIGCRTLFATHYHELTQLAESLQGVRNLNVQVREWDDTVVFMHRLVRGGADKSYGIHVARLAGVPQAVLERAKEVLSQLEMDHHQAFQRAGSANAATVRSTAGPLQLTLFAPAEPHPILEQLRAIETGRTTPLEALQWIERWQAQLR